jgi:hypothetical protein
LYAAARISHSERYSRGVISILQLVATTDLHGRLRYVTAKLFPPAQLLRERHELARHGRAGLAASRVLRVASCVVRLPAALLDWRRQRQAPVRASSD